MRKRNLIISNEASFSARQRLVDVNVKLAARPAKTALTTRQARHTRRRAHALQPAAPPRLKPFSGALLSETGAPGAAGRLLVWGLWAASSALLFPA